MVMKMHYDIISSNSKGNSIIIEDFMMLDCGLTYSKIKKYLSKIKIIFISHVHTDHLKSSTIKQIAHNYPNIKYICGSEYVLMKLVECGVPYTNIYALKENTWFDLGLIKVRIEQVQHDTPNYLLKWEYQGKKCIYMVDLNSTDSIEAKNYELYLIESNYQEELLEKHIKECEDENKLYYLNRAKHTHLSQDKANQFLLESMGDNSEYCYIHKSNYNFEEE